MSVFALGVLQKWKFWSSLGVCREQKSHSHRACGAFFRRRAFFLRQNKALLMRLFSEPEFSRFRTRGVEKMQNWYFRRGFAGIGNRVLMQRGALVFAFLLKFANDLMVFCWRGDFLGVGQFFWFFFEISSYFSRFSDFWLNSVQFSSIQLNSAASYNRTTEL